MLSEATEYIIVSRNEVKRRKKITSCFGRHILKFMHNIALTNHKQQNGNMAAADFMDDWKE
jgi:hypothetical protein